MISPGLAAVLSIAIPLLGMLCDLAARQATELARSSDADDRRYSAGALRSSFFLRWAKDTARVLLCSM